MKEDEGKRRRIISEELKKKIKKKPYNERIGNQDYTFSLLRKKNQMFFFTNQRLLVLNGNQTIGYARNIPEDTMLPFNEQRNIPTLKCQLRLAGVEIVVTEDDLLKIQFIKETEMKPWQFICESKQVAYEWKIAIVEACKAAEMTEINEPINVYIPDDRLTAASSTIFYSNANPRLTHINQSVHRPAEVVANGRQPQERQKQEVKQINVIEEVGNSQKEEASRNTFAPVKSAIKVEQSSQKIVEKQQRQSQISEVFSIAVTPPSSPIKQIAKDVSIPDFVVEYQLKQIQQKQKQQKMNPKLQNQKEPEYNEIKSIPSEKYDNIHWDYEFLKGQNQFIIIQKFQKYVQQLSCQVIDQLSLRQDLRQYQPQQQTSGYFKYKINHITLEVALLQLKQISSFQDHSTVVSHGHIKKMRKEFKNAQFILERTQNKGRFRVPLMMILHYKGFQVFAKANIHTTNQFSSPVQTLQQDTSLLEQQTQISRELFQIEANLTVAAADSTWFKSLSRENNRMGGLDVCFLNNINFYLPQDFFGIGREGSSQFQLRPQILEDKEYEGVLLNGGDLASAVDRLKITNQTKRAINLLTTISSSIPTRATILIQDIQNLDEWITNSEQLSTLIHSSGINMRYLGLLLEISKQPWLRSILLSEIIARSVKHYVRYELQESTLNLGVQTLEKAKEFQIGQVISWFNRFFGIGQQSDFLWRQIARQAHTYFKATITRQGISLGFLLQALQYHCDIKIDFRTKKHLLFKQSNVLNKTDFISFSARPKVFNPSFTDQYQLIQNRIQILSPQNFEYLSKLLNLGKQGNFDSHYSMNGFDKQIRVYLANWLAPHQAPLVYQQDNHNIPSKHSFELMLTAIKWQLKSHRIAQSQKIKQKLIDSVSEWLGIPHPILTQLYDLFARYYQSFHDQYKKAFSFSRLALNNQEILLGNNHFKLADSYYALGEVQLHYQKQLQSLHSFKKALQILQQNRQGNTEAFVQTGLKVAQLSFSINSLQEAQSICQKTFQASQQLNLKDLYFRSAELLSRCLEVNGKWQQYSRLSQQLASILHFYVDSLPIYQKMLKIILLPFLYRMAKRNRENGYLLLQILKSIPIGGLSLDYSFLLLKGRTNQKTFPWSLMECFDSFETFCLDKDLRGLARRWKGLEATTGESKTVNFMGELEATRNVVSLYFLEGVLTQL